MSSTLTKKLAAVGAAASIAVMGAFAATAHAQSSVIDDAQKGSITVHKYALPAGTSLGTPTGTTADEASLPAEATPLDGATFKIEKLRFDLTNYAEFEEASKLTADTVAPDDKTGTSEECTTGTSTSGPTPGVCDFTNLDVGAYLLTETKTPENHVGAVPSIVFVPLTNTTSNGWNYNVHVYPKNEIATDLPVKTDITPPGTVVTLGEAITYQIEKTFTFKGRTEFSKVQFVDDLSTHEHLEFGADPSRLDIKVIASDSQNINEEEYVAGDYDVDLQNNKLTVSLNTSGLAKFNANVYSAKNPTDVQVTVKVQFKAFVKAIPEATGTVGDDGIIRNSASTIHNDGTGTGDVTTTTGPNEQGKTVFGSIKVVKIKESDSSPLQDATFQLYQCDAQNKTTGSAISIKHADGSTKTEFVTAVDGTITLPGIRAADNLNLCLVETQAPTGYQLNPTPIKVEFTETIVQAATANTVDVTVKNISDDDVISKLPLTGGAGIVLFLVVGGTLAGVAIWQARRVSAKTAA